MRRLRARVVLVLLLFSSVAWVVVTRRIPDSADQAIVGLMGIHILEGRGHPVFYFGSTYAGSVEAHLVAGAFALFGVSAATYRGVMAFLAVAVVLSIWGVARSCGDRTSARWAAAYVSLPPFYFLYKVLTSDGAYASTCLVASGIVGSALWYRIRSEGGGALVAPAAALGFAGGLGLWITPLFFPVFAATGTWLGAVERRRLRVRPLLALAGAFVAGSLPWWLWNVRHGWASLAAPEASVATLSQIVRNVGRLFLTSLPVVLGAAQPNTPPPPLGFRIGALVLAGVVVASSLRRAFRGHAPTGLLVWVLVAVSAAAVLPARFNPLEPRYLTPAYVVFAPLFGAAVCDSYRAGARGRVLAAALVTAFAALNLQGLVSARRHLGLEPGSTSVTGRLGELVAELGRLGVTRTWTSYWASYRITFESREAVIAAPFASDEWFRWEPHQRLVMEATDPAVVLLPERARAFDEFLAERGIPVRRSSAAGFAIFTGLGPSTVEVLRRAQSLPLPRSAYRVEWMDVSAPTRLAPGAAGKIRARYRNISPWSWSLAVHLGAWLQGPGPDGPRREVPSRGYAAGWIDPGHEGTSEIDVVAPLEPGDYTLEVDLVHEGVDWFATLGSSTKLVHLEVK